MGLPVAAATLLAAAIVVFALGLLFVVMWDSRPEVLKTTEESPPSSGRKVE